MAFIPAVEGGFEKEVCFTDQTGWLGLPSRSVSFD